MRYFFAIIGVIIVWRSFSWLRKDRRMKHKRLRQLPDAGMIGVLTVEQGGRHLKAGYVIPIPHEGVLGFLRTCDVVVPVDDVATAHLDFTFVDGKGLFIYPRRGCDTVVDGVPILTRRDSLLHPMQHGSVLNVGQAVLRLGVFAGFHVKEACQAECPPSDARTMDELWVSFLSEFQPLQTGYAPPPRESCGQSPYAPPVHQPLYDPRSYEQTLWQGGDDNAP